MKQVGMGVLGIYDALADHFEVGARISQYFAPEWIAKHAYELESLPECHVLDLGCGTGLNVKLLREHRAGVRADGVDFSSGMLKLARSSGNYERLYTHDLHHALADIPSETYDLVLAFGFLEHLIQVYICLSECRRVLKINGRLWASFQRFEAEDPGSPARRTFVGELAYTGYSAGQILHATKVFGMRLNALEPLVGYITEAGFPCPYYVLQAQKMPALNPTTETLPE
jgi:predicted TPR repeat methyltransferase